MWHSSGTGSPPPESARRRFTATRFPGKIGKGRPGDVKGWTETHAAKGRGSVRNAWEVSWPNRRLKGKAFFTPVRIDKSTGRERHREAPPPPKQPEAGRDLVNAHRSKTANGFPADGNMSKLRAAPRGPEPGLQRVSGCLLKFTAYSHQLFNLRLLAALPAST